MEKALNIYLKFYNAGESSKIILRRIAALYAKLGNIEKAEHFIVKMNKLI
jgi:hypothetical protein